MHLGAGSLDMKVERDLTRVWEFPRLFWGYFQQENKTLEVLHVSKPIIEICKGGVFKRFLCSQNIGFKVYIIALFDYLLNVICVITFIHTTSFYS